MCIRARARTLLKRLFDDPKKYDLTRVGRYKINQKLGLDTSLDPVSYTHLNLEVQLITPIAMEKAMRFAIREGGRTVGAGRILSLIHI